MRPASPIGANLAGGACASDDARCGGKNEPGRGVWDEHRKIAKPMLRDYRARCVSGSRRFLPSLLGEERMTAAEEKKESARPSSFVPRRLLLDVRSPTLAWLVSPGGNCRESGGDPEPSTTFLASLPARIGQTLQFDFFSPSSFGFLLPCLPLFFHLDTRESRSQQAVPSADYHGRR